GGFSLRMPPFSLLYPFYMNICAYKVLTFYHIDDILVTSVTKDDEKTVEKRFTRIAAECLCHQKGTVHPSGSPIKTFSPPLNLVILIPRYLRRRGHGRNHSADHKGLRSRWQAHRTPHQKPIDVGGDTVEFWLEILKFLFLGFLQGFTEPIPVSSSGHLMIAQHFLGITVEGHKQLAFAVLVNFASLLAVLVIYRKDLQRLATRTLRYLQRRDPADEAEARFVLYIVLGTIPAAVIGLLFNDLIESRLTGISVIGITLIITGIALWVIRNLRGRKMDGDLRLPDILIVGFAQALALIPGISRSGATSVAGMLRGMNQETALRFSFMLYITVTLGGMILEVDDILQQIYD